MMKKIIILLFALIIGSFAVAGTVGLPTERLALPDVDGEYLVCIWDDSAGDWYSAEFETYDLSGTYDFTVPAWDSWYWVGLWDVANEEYVFSKWIGHFQTD